MWTVVSQIHTLLSKSCIVYFYIMLAFLFNCINAHGQKGFHANETKSTCCISTKIVLAHFVSKGISPHLLLLPSDYDQPPLRWPGQNSIWNCCLTKSLGSKIQHFWTEHLQGCFLTFCGAQSQNHRSAGLEGVSVECYQLLLSPADLHGYTPSCSPGSVYLNMGRWKACPSAGLFRTIKRLA